MARPNKTGLEYFPLDVDFFNDEKISAISGEFGIKGELACIKLLCAIYRNGYFALWSEMLRMKLIKELPGVSADLLETIVSRLVRWGFFDKALFDENGILTSNGIQRRYFEITRRRMSSKDENLPYLLVNVDNNGVSVDRNYRSRGVNVDNNPQSKGNKSKGKVEKKNYDKKEKKTVADFPIPPEEEENPPAMQENPAKCEDSPPEQETTDNPPEQETTDNPPEREARPEEVKPPWRESFDTYLAELRAAYAAAVSDEKYMAERQRYHPRLNIGLTIEKACKDFWATEAGWKHKKASGTVKIDWRRTFNNAMALGGDRVWKTREEEKAESEQKKIIYI
jgi:hypothetical protein